MPKLPDPFGPRATPRATGGVVDYGRADVSGIMSVAESVYQFSSDRVQKQDEFDYASAKSDFLIEQSKIISELEADPDYETHEERYSSASKKALEAVSGRLKENDRQLFGMEMELQDQRGLLQVRDRARVKDKEVVRGRVEASAIALREAYLSPSVGPDIRSQIAFAFAEQVDGAVRRGAIGADEAVLIKKKFGVDLIEARARMLLSQGKSKEAEEFLNSADAVAHMPRDARAQLLEGAREQDVFGQARTLADGVLSVAGDDRAAANTMIAKIADPKVRAQAQSFVDGDLSRMAMAKSEQEAVVYEEFTNVLLQTPPGNSPQTSLEKYVFMHPEKWAGLSAKSRAALQKMAKGDETTEDNMLYAKVMSTLQENGRIPALQLVYQNPSAFTSGTFKGLVDKLSQDETTKDLLTFKQRIDSYSKKLTDEQKAALQIEAERRFRLEEEALKQRGETLSPDRKNEIVENLIVESTEFFVGPTISLPQRDRDAQFNLIDALRNKMREAGEDPTPEVLGKKVELAGEMASEIRRVYRKKGITLTNDQAMRAWLDAGMPEELEDMTDQESVE